jgi:hypothetical protein
MPINIRLSRNTAKKKSIQYQKKKTPAIPVDIRLTRKYWILKIIQYYVVFRIISKLLGL